MAVLCDLRQQRYRTIATAFGSRAIQRILIENASGQVMPKSNADAFPAHGNHYGKTAGVKIDFALDLLTGSIVSHSLQAATEREKSIGKEFVIEFRRSDLVLRDMGYFSLNLTRMTTTANPPTGECGTHWPDSAKNLLLPQNLTLIIKRWSLIIL